MSTTIIDDVENVWGSEEDGVAAHQWTNLEKEFTNAGYREGITAGKESALQEGFNDGFDNIGAPLGREIGILRGAAAAALSLLSSTEPRLSGSSPMDLERRKEELRSIMQDLGRISLADLAPRDMQAEAHMAQHKETDVPGEISHATDQEADGSDAFQEPLVRPAVEDLRRLRLQLSNTLTQLGLGVALD